jgi:hypothetical protein
MEHTPMNQFPRPRPSAAQIEKQRVANARYERLESKLLHAAELIADQCVERYSEPKSGGPAPANVRRREMANAMKVWRTCAQRTCRRTRACRGEPAHCLQACFPALPDGTFEAYVAESRRRKRKR